MYKQVFKPIADRCLALLLLLLFSPLWLIISILSIAFNGKPLLFKQRRTGQGGVLFTIFKLRTIPIGGDGSDDTMKLKLSIWSRFLRKSGFDEWPQLFNILLGQMSFVGPRPLLPEYLGRYSSDQFRRHDTLPGLTGLAQIKGRNSIEWDKRFEYDIKYVDEQSFRMDLKILLLTPIVFLQKKGSEISEPFTGNQ